MTDLDVSKTIAAVALRPGVVLGDPDDGLINFVANLQDVERGEVGGYNARVVGGWRQLFPRLSKVDFELIKAAQLPEVDGVLEDLLSGMTHLSAVERSGYLSARKLVQQEMNDGSKRWILVPRVPEALTEIEILDAEREQGDEPFESFLDVSAQRLQERRKKRKYTLAQLFTDLDVLAKYNLSVRSVETAKRVAVTDPATSAAMFQDMMNRCQTDVAVTVVAGEYSRDRTQARNAIVQMCKSVPRSDATVSSLVMMDKFFMFGPGGEGDWYVSGPLKYASEVSFVYWLVAQEGVTLPSILLAMELVLLSIDICDGDSCAEPEISYHAALFDDTDDLRTGIPESTAVLLSAADRMTLATLAERIHPVYASDGRQMASSVRVTGNFVLVNSHVVAADANCEIGGAKVQVRSQLSRDLWSAKVIGDSTPWVLREPEKGETVVVCCVKDNELVVSAPLRVTSIDQSCIVTTLDESVGHGMSGGALVALRDFALLGVHSASTLTNLLSYRFGERQFSELLEADSVSAFSRYDDVGGFAAGMIQHFKKKGLQNVLSTAIDSLTPVFSEGKHVGMLLCNGTHAYTSCSPDMPLRVGDERVTVKFETASMPGFFRTHTVGESKVPVYRRTPEYYEKVFIVGFDTEAYVSNETRVVHIGPDSRSFVVADLPALDKSVKGGLVMGWDGALLGCCGFRSNTTAAGIGYVCWSLPREEMPQKSDPRALLAAAFPFLSLAAWSDALLEEVFTHASVGSYRSSTTFNVGNRPLANIGDNVAKAALYRSLREHAVPHSQWSGVMQSLQSNANFARVAWDFGFASLLVVGSGVSMQRDAKPYADLTEALIGAASLTEKPDIVNELCSVMAILFRPKPLLERSASEV